MAAAAFHAAGGRLPIDGPPLLAVIDARRGEAFCQAFGRHGLDAKPFVAPYHDIAAMIGRNGGWRLCGSGAEHLNAAAGTAYETIHTLQAAPVESVARLAATLNAASSPAEPLYLRAPDARPQENFVLRRA